MRILKTLILSSFFFTAFQAQGSIALRGKDFSAKAAHKTSNSYGKKLDLNQKFVKKGRQGLTSNDVAKMIPYNLSATNNGDFVKEEIFKKSAKSFLNSPVIQNSFLAKTMKKAQKATKLEMAIKADAPKGQAVKSTKKSPADLVVIPQPIEHKFDVNVEALKKQARLTYKGYINSQVQYNHINEAINVSLEENLSENSKIALSHQKGRDGSQQMVNFQMNW